MIAPEKYRCWIVDGLPGDTEPHFKTKAVAARRLRELRREDEDRAAGGTYRQLDAPCWTVRCDGECNMAIDEDGDGLFHHTSADDAMETVRLWEWVLIDHERVLCPEDLPEGLRPPSPAEQEQAGQLRLPGVKA